MFNIDLWSIPVDTQPDPTVYGENTLVLFQHVYRVLSCAGQEVCAWVEVTELAKCVVVECVLILILHQVVLEACAYDGGPLWGGRGDYRVVKFGLKIG